MAHALTHAAVSRHARRSRLSAHSKSKRACRRASTPAPVARSRAKPARATGRALASVSRRRGRRLTVRRCATAPHSSCRAAAATLAGGRGDVAARRRGEQCPRVGDTPAAACRRRCASLPSFRSHGRVDGGRRRRRCHLRRRCAARRAAAKPLGFLISLLPGSLCLTRSRSRRVWPGTYVDKKCPFTSNVSIRGRILSGALHATPCGTSAVATRRASTKQAEARGTRAGVPGSRQRCALRVA